MLAEPAQRTDGRQEDSLRDFVFWDGQLARTDADGETQASLFEIGWLEVQSDIVGKADGAHAEIVDHRIVRDCGGRPEIGVGEFQPAGVERGGDRLRLRGPPDIEDRFLCVGNRLFG